MKNLLLLLLISASLIAEGQNYQCLQAGTKHYFTNGNGYLRGIRIDSVRTMGDTTVYYPFHTPRGAYDPGLPLTTSSLDTNGGSWLGKRVLQKGDGTFIFDSYWNDSVIIKTQANAGDSWVFYRDTSPLYYKATMLGVDTMTVLGAIDSVRKILITAHNPSGIVTTDPLDSFQIILSKNKGFVRVMDLYTFPYHKPDSTYRLGLDFFLDRSTNTVGTINGYIGSPVGPNTTVTSFNLVDFVNPNEQQLHNWNVGDVFYSDNELGIPIFGTVTYTYLSDTVTDKVVSGHYINYTISGSTFACPTPPYYPCSLICKSGMYSFSDSIYPIIDTVQMPEDWHYHGKYIFYAPGDSGFCSHAPAYSSVLPGYRPSLGWVYEVSSYKLGIGKTEFIHNDGDPTYETDKLLFYKIGSVTCGSTLRLPGGNSVTPQSLYTIFPNPATEELTIKTTLTQPYILTLQNMLGETVQTIRSASQEQTINVAALPAGVYNVSIIDDAGSRYNEKVVVLH